MPKPHLLLIGGGKMGGALLQGWYREALVDPIVIDPAPAPAWIRDAAVPWLPSAEELPRGYVPDVVVIAIKPQLLAQHLPAYGGFAASGDTLFLSIAAGRSLSSLGALLGGSAAITRAMPNTPAAIGKGITGCIANERVTPQQRDLVTALLGCVGQVRWLAEESLIDVVTAISGSGPAYLFLLTEVLAKAGAAAGLPAGLAMDFARATVTGAGALLDASEEDPGQLRANVTSPNGTTAAALEILMHDDALQRLITDTVQAAIRRAGELAT